VSSACCRRRRKPRPTTGGAQERAIARAGRSRHFIGTPASVRSRIEALVKSTSASELIVTTMIHDPEERRRSYELLAG
jgi:alkanesulfonate monooxygenase SsuD/methylene tetrahydromethanopterin reductase-like flavin-dependent oxidoreductase (luciferase family)